MVPKLDGTNEISQRDFFKNTNAWLPFPLWSDSSGQENYRCVTGNEYPTTQNVFCLLMTVMVSLHQSSKIDIFSELDIVLQRDGKKQLSWEKTTVDLYPIYSCLVFDVQFCVFFFFLFGWVFVFCFCFWDLLIWEHTRRVRKRGRENHNQTPRQAWSFPQPEIMTWAGSELDG